MSLGSLSVTDCYFESCSSQEPLLAFPDIPEGLSVVIRGERFVRPARFTLRLMALLAGATGTVRLGPCPLCGYLCPYVDGVELEQHAMDECIVAQVMES